MKRPVEIRNSGKHHVRFVITLDEDDETMNNDDIKSFLDIRSVEYGADSIKSELLDIVTKLNPYSELDWWSGMIESYAEYGAIGVIVLLFIGMIHFLKTTIFSKLQEIKDINIWKKWLDYLLKL